LFFKQNLERLDLATEVIFFV